MGKLGAHGVMEARLVSLLATGQALPKIARQLGIAFETARTHLARARAKTGTSSQVELVRTVLTALLPVFGMLKRTKGASLSIEEINEIAARG